MSANVTEVQPPLDYTRSGKNWLMQRQISSYFSITTKLQWVGQCSAGSGGGSGGLIVREHSTRHGAALGFLCENATGKVKIGFWASAEEDAPEPLELRLSRPLAGNSSDTVCYLKLVVNLVRNEAYWSLDGHSWEWMQPGSMTPNHDAGYTGSEMSWFKYSFTTLYPGLLICWWRQKWHIYTI